MSTSKWKPYPNYQSTEIPWIREIPSDWEIKRVKHVSYCLDSLRVPLNGEERGKIQGKYPYYGATKQVDSISEYIFDEHLVLLGEDGAPFFDPLRDVAYEISGKTWVNNHAHVLRAVGIDPTFLTHALNIVGYEHYINGSTRDKLNQQQMNEITIPYPTEKDSEIIGKWLKKFDYQIEIISLQLEKLLGILVEKRTTLITKAVTEGLNPNAKMKETGLNWFPLIPSHWRLQKVKHIASINPSNVDKKKYPDQEEVRLANYVDVYYNDSITEDLDLMIATASESEIAKFSLRAGDLIITKDSETWDDIAIPAFVPKTMEGVVCGYHLTLIRPNHEQILGDFLFRTYQAIGVRDQYHYNANGVTRYGLGSYWVDNGVIPVPPIDEQREIAIYINKKLRLIETIRMNAESVMAKLRENRVAVVSAVITGKIDVRSL